MLYLQKNGIRFGYNGISHTNSRHRRTYYATESTRITKLLDAYKEQHIVAFFLSK